jgi:hypothetical protein
MLILGSTMGISLPFSLFNNKKLTSFILLASVLNDINRDVLQFMMEKMKLAAGI